MEIEIVALSEAPIEIEIPMLLSRRFSSKAMCPA